jgi:hypothetical protein
MTFRFAGILAFFGVLLGLSLAGCRLHRIGPGRYVVTPVPMRVTVSNPPPAPRPHVVTRPVRPHHNCSWVRGHYHWTGRAWVWKKGHWVHRPRPGAVWIAPRVVRVRGGCHYTPGHWK